MDTRDYVMQFPDGDDAEYVTNTRAQNIYDLCGINVNEHVISDAIIDFNKDGADTTKAENYAVINGSK